MTSRKPYVKFGDRCRIPHAGSSTCDGCDPSMWLNDSPFPPSELGAYWQRCECPRYCPRCERIDEQKKLKPKDEPRVFKDAGTAEKRVEYLVAENTALCVARNEYEAKLAEYEAAMPKVPQEPYEKEMARKLQVATDALERIAKGDKQGVVLVAIARDTLKEIGID